ncbi:hypothetical protein NVP1161O_148 [Vibrio phage 1.161.O._10N.261.48.C5]|nr:hypothetical protein NVP1161O_148 [Vibrio phage 1.161.O._10N.261.48.C5]
MRLEVNTYIDKGDVFFHYTDTSIVFSFVEGVLYGFDRDNPSVDIFKNGDFEKQISEYLPLPDLQNFVEDFCRKGLFLNSRFDTHHVALDENFLQDYT